MYIVNVSSIHIYKLPLLFFCRDTAASYETFRWAAQADGTYELTAMVNKQQVSTVGGSGQLQNNAGSTTGVTPSRYRLIQTDNGGAAQVPAAGVLKSVSTGKFVVSTQADPTLRVTAGKNFSSKKLWFIYIILC